MRKTVKVEDIIARAKRLRAWYREALAEGRTASARSYRSEIDGCINVIAMAITYDISDERYDAEYFKIYDSIWNDETA